MDSMSSQQVVRELERIRRALQDISASLKTLVDRDAPSQDDDNEGA